LEFYEMVELSQEKINEYKKTIPVKIGERIKNIRKEKKITQTELAQLTGKDRQYVYKIEKGIVTPNVVTITLLALAMGVNVTDFFDFDI